MYLVLMMRVSRPDTRTHDPAKYEYRYFLLIYPRRSFFDLDPSRLSTLNYLKRASPQATIPGFPEATILPLPYVDIDEATGTAAAFCRIIEGLTRVRMNPYAGHRLRAVVHHQVTDEDVEALIKGAAAAAALLS